MKPLEVFIFVVASSVLALSTAAEAKGYHGNSGHGHAKHDGTLNCPPGLAKKNPPCIPPGQAKKLATPEVDILRYRSGDILPDDYVVLADPRIYNPNIDFIYARYGDYLYLIDRATSVVLTRLGLVTDWTWVWDGTTTTDATGCPPGLAKKDPPCVPPGLAAKSVAADEAPDDPYGIGEVLPQGYVVVIDPKLYAPNDTAQFVRESDQIYRADGTTGQVLDEVGEVGKLIQ